MFSNLLEVKIFPEAKNSTVKNMYYEDPKLVGVNYVDIASRNYMLTYRVIATMTNPISRDIVLQMCVFIAKLSPSIKCKTICSEYYYDLLSSNPLFNSSPLFSFLGVYKSFLKNSAERFIKNSKEKFIKKGLLFVLSLRLTLT